VVPPVVPPVSPPPPTGTPEPATIVSSLIGLAVAAGYGLRRRKGEEGPAVEGAGDSPADAPKPE
jgi:hypothetical protein